MSDKHAVVAIWERQWATDRPGPSAIETRYAQEAFAALSPFVSDSDRIFLEVGCGTGRLCALMARARPDLRVHAVDLAPTSVASAMQLGLDLGLSNMCVTRGDLFDLPYRSESFDVVLSEGVIQHFQPGGNPSRESSLREMLRVLRPGGTLITCVVNWHCYPHTLYKWLLRLRGVPYEFGYEQSFARRELEAVLAAEGLGEMESVAYYPAHALYRLAPYIRMFRTLGSVLDKHAPSWLNHRCGFELLVKARKRR